MSRSRPVYRTHSFSGPSAGVTFERKRSSTAPSCREQCTVDRPRSNTPLRALTLLNDPTYVEAARKFAERILREGGNGRSARLAFAYRRALGREPRAEETETLGPPIILKASRTQVRQAQELKAEQQKGLTA